MCSDFQPVIVLQVGDEHLRKQHRSLAELHYSKAVSLFLSLKEAPCELLRTLLERVAFAEFTMAGEQVAIKRQSCENTIFFPSMRSSCNIMFLKGQSSSLTKLKSLTGAMEIMTEAHHAFRLIQKELLEKQEEVGVKEILFSRLWPLYFIFFPFICLLVKSTSCF